MVLLVFLLSLLLTNTTPCVYDVRSVTTLSSRQIDDILEKRNSPAAGSGHIFIRLGSKYDIDPAIPLAIFLYESNAGTDRQWVGQLANGKTTHNVGNIVCGNYTQCHKGYRVYDSWEDGIEATFSLLHFYAHARDIYTVDKIIPLWAEHEYSSNICRLLRQWKDDAYLYAEPLKHHGRKVY